ncbi:MAG: amino acid adenylation domain-containing protein [Lachnospiraceae bacterium]|nr:amino acid adenylation domain-containing protein [Lachnospiraceae bacterium]
MLNGLYPADRLAYIFDDCSAKAVITPDWLNDADSFDALTESVQLSPEDPAIIVYTSGSTGKPKGVLINHLAVMSCLSRNNKALKLNEDDVIGEGAPFFFIAGSTIILYGLAYGMTNVLVPMAAMRDPELLSQVLADNLVTVTFISPKILRYFKPAHKELRFVLTGSERLSGIYSDEYILVNTLGLSESCGGLFAFFVDKAYDNTPIGLPMGDEAAYLLDENGNEAEEGEICVAGNFASCYINLPEESTKTFVPNPFKDRDGHEKLLKTGDIGKRLPDGNIVYLNRKDWMVKINGQRVEPGEVEAALRKISGIKDAAVKDHTDARGVTYLAAYYVSETELEDEKLRLALKEYLPDYMIPSFFIRMDALPINANGKLDRGGLPIPDLKSYQSEYAEPETPEQEKLCKAFEAILALDRVGIDDDFFALGGDSVKAAGLMTHIKELPVAIADIYSGKTVRKISELMEKNVDLKAVSGAPLNAAAAGVARYPLTPMERGMYLEQKLEPDSISYNLNIGIYINGADRETIHTAVSELFLAHEALHSRYGEDNGVPCRIIENKVPQLTDGDALDRSAFEAALEDPGESFDLEDSIPIRLTLHPINEGGFGLHLRIHHIAFDGGSMEFFVNELAALLKGDTAKVQTADLYGIAARRDDMQAEPETAFFEEMFSDGVPANEMPIKGVRPKKHPLSDTVLTSELGAKEIEALKEKAKQYGVTMFELMLSVSAAVLGQYCASEDVVVGVPVNTRDSFSSEMIGMFVNTIPVRIRPKHAATISDYFAETAETVRRASRECSVPFETLVGLFCKERDTSRSPLFDMSVNFLPVSDPYDDGGVSIDFTAPLQQMSRDIGFVIRSRNDYMQILMQYSSELFDTDVAENFMEQFTESLRLLAWSDTVLVRDLTALPERQRSQLEKLGCTAQEEIPEKLLHRMFEERVARQPDDTALIASDKIMTYAELNTEANRVAWSLAEQGIKRGDSAVLLLPRRSCYFSAMFGVLKTGAAFIPCDPEYPHERIRHITEDSGASCIITTEEHLADYPTGKAFDIQKLIRGEKTGNPDIEQSGDDLAYMIYTSGSTGKPKGVMLRHVGICSFFTNSRANILYDFEKGDISAILSVTTVSFDLGLKDTVGMLINGRTVVFADEEQMNDPRELTVLFEKTGADAINATPSRYLQYMEYEPFRNALAKCRLIAAGGEQYPAALLKKLQELTRARLINTYGPTETTISANMAELTTARRVTAGRPLLNYTEYIVDRDGNRVPRGVTGELIIGGPGVALGYRNLPEMTAERFVNYNGMRVYRSGDYARYDADGNVEILGRMDNQVKLRGLRIELGEIEGLMEQQPGIKRAVAAIRPLNGQDELCAWFTADSRIDIFSLRDELKKYLTLYMVPAAIMQLDEIPVTPNGKTDMKALPTPEPVREESIPPQNETQQRIFDITAAVIGGDSFGIDTDLYFAGLTSLNSVNLGIGLSEAFDVNVQIRDLREHNTVRKLERLILGMDKEETFAMQDEYAVTKVQEGVFFETQSHPETTIYNIPTLIALDNGVDIGRLKAALVAAVEAHPYLKTRFFISENGAIRQKRNDSEPFTEADIRETDCGRIDEVKDGLVKPYDLLKDRLFRVMLIHTPNEYFLFFEAHHAIYDGTAKAILMRDISRAYAGEKLAAETYSGFEAAQLEERLRASGHYAKAKEYYTNMFSGCETDCLPMGDAQGDDEGSGTIITEGKVDASEVAAFCTQNNLSENAFYTAVFGYVAAKYCGRDDTVFTTVNNGRNDPRFAESVSMFVRTYPVLSRTGSREVKDYIRDIGNQLIDSLAYDVYSFEEISRELGVRADMIFAYQGAITDSRREFCGLPYRNIELHLDEAKAGIEFLVYPAGSKTVTYYCDFRKSLFTGGFMRRFIRAYERALSEFMRRTKLSDIELIDEDTQKKLDSFNDTSKDYEISDIVTLFERQAKAVPDNIAVVFKDIKLTYKQTDEITDRIAAYLANRGIGKGDAVSVLIPRCEYMVIASMGVLKSGALYQPLDPSYPSERLEFMISDAGAKLVIAERSLMDHIPGYRGGTLFIDEISALPASDGKAAAPAQEDGFILLYTSGSTGTPKGVILEHRNLSNFCSWYRGYYNLTAESRVAAYASYGFDASMMDMYPALTTGACVCIIPEEIRLDFPALQMYFDDNAITHSFMTTQVGRQFASYYSGTSLKHLSVGGETLAPVYPEGKSFTFHNAYGPTECTIITTIFQVDRLYRRMPIGTPLDNFKLYVVDKYGKMLPPGVPGELWVSGRGVGRGYLNRPEKNAEVFFSNPFTNETGYGRVYRTGDVVRWTEDGIIDFVGRSDSQVKIRGFRIELTEVETIIREFTGVKDATVQAFDSPSGGKYLAAYIVGDEKIDVDALCSFIAENKPPYMVPEAVMQIDSIPLNQNQKVNRRALPAPVLNPKDEEKSGVSRPMTRFEGEIVAVVKKVVGDLEISPTVSLTNYGLTSISAIGLVTTLSDRFGVDYPVSKLIDGASIVDIEDFIFSEWDNSGVRGVAGVTEMAADTEKRNEYPLSSVQLAVYYDTMKRAADISYNIPTCLAFTDIDADRLAEAVKAAVRAHSSLNTHIEVHGGQLVQARADEIKPEVKIITLAENELDAYRNSFVRPFDLETGPLYRFEIVKSGNRTYLFMDIHHIVFDGFSLSIFMRDIGSAYSGETLAPEKYTAFDYALADSEYKNSARYKESEEYFAKLLASFESPTLIPTDKQGDPEQGAIGEKEVYVPKNEAEAYCREHGLTPNALFLAGSFYAVSRFAASKEIFISTISSGRGDVKLSNSVGMFVHTIPLVMDLSKDMTASELIKASAGVMRGSIANEDYPFATLAANYGYSTEIMYECQIGMISDGGKLGRHDYEVVPLSSESPKFKISLVIFESGDSYVIRVRYNDALYTGQYMQTLADALAMSVKTMYEKPTADVKHISLINDEQRDRLLKIGQGEKADIPVKLLHKMFERSAKENADKTALIACDKTLTFAQLENKANIIANGLISRGIGKGGRVVLLLPRRSFYFAAAFGVLKAGAAFIPCDPQYPADRINHIIGDSDAKFILTTDDKLADYPAEKALDIETLLAGSDTACPDVDVSPEDLAYMIYTSGSTGKPKGVMLRHKGICNYVTPNDGNPMFQSVRDVTGVMVTVTTVSFDMSFKDSFGILCNGKTVVFADEEQMNDPRALAQLFAATHADSFNATPSRMRQYLDYGKFREEAGKLKLLVCGAEQYPEALLAQIRELGIPTIINTYGPTEITVSSNMAYLMDADHISVGRPIANCNEYIVDADGNLLPEGVMGELLIGGPGVAAGYVNLPEKTAASFISYNGERVYRSGDYARWDEDGNVMILGRIDGQVKLRGLRIEPSEIEGLMEKQPGIKRSVVVVRKLNGQDNLCAYFTAEKEIDTHTLRDALAEKLTHYMVPAAFMQLDEIPVTPNGKTDLRALPEPKALEGGEYTAPTNKMEEFFCELFKKVLGLERVGINDDFFSVGGTSLSAASIMAGASENGYNVTFGDVFRLKTPAALAAKFVHTDDSASDSSNRFDNYDYTAINKLLSGNDLEAFESGEKRPIGNILLTGATGYMGMHVLAEYLRSESGIAWCFVRKGRYADPMLRLHNMLFYYFNDEFEDKLDRVRVINGDVTSYDTFALLENEPINTVFNCAASVKHFSSGTYIEDINVGGAANCVRFCERTGARLIHFSTTSVAGGMIVSKASEIRALDEKSLYFGQLLDNQYTVSKLLSERTVLEAAAERGIDAKIIRVGTLAAREADGEFQINFLTNSFMERLRSYVILGCFPYSLMNAVMRMGPIDTSAKGFMRLAQTPKACCLFNAINNHTIPTIDVIRVMREMGLDIEIVDDNAFAAALTDAQKDPNKAAILASMLAYKANSNAVPVQTKCEYTTQVLARMGFFWNLTDSQYIRKFIESLYTLGFFDATNLNR